MDALDKTEKSVKEKVDIALKSATVNLLIVILCMVKKQPSRINICIRRSLFACKRYKCVVCLA